MIDLDKVNNVWARIYKYQDCKNDNQTINYVRAIQYGKAVIRDVTPSELLSMDIEDVKKITKIDELPKFKDKKLEELISIFDVDDASKFLKKSHQETADDFFKCIGYVKDVSYKEKYEIAVVGNIVIIKFWFKRKKKKEHHYHYAVCHSHFSTSW